MAIREAVSDHGAPGRSRAGRRDVTRVGCGLGRRVWRQVTIRSWKGWSSASDVSPQLTIGLPVSRSRWRSRCRTAHDGQHTDHGENHQESGNITVHVEFRLTGHGVNHGVTVITVITPTYLKSITR